MNRKIPRKTLIVLPINETLLKHEKFDIKFKLWYEKNSLDKRAKNQVSYNERNSSISSRGSHNIFKDYQDDTLGKS